MKKVDWLPLAFFVSLAALGIVLFMGGHHGLGIAYLWVAGPVIVAWSVVGIKRRIARADNYCRLAWTHRLGLVILLMAALALWYLSRDRATILVAMAVIAVIILFWIAIAATFIGKIREKEQERAMQKREQYGNQCYESGRDRAYQEQGEQKRRDHELRYLLGCPEYADRGGTCTDDLVNVYYLTPGGLRHKDNIAKFLTMLRALDERDYPTSCVVNITQGSILTKVFIGKPGGTPLWTTTNVAINPNSTLILEDTAGAVVYLTFDRTKEENIEALLCFVSSYTSVADLFVKTVQRLGVPALANCGADSPALEGLRGLIEIGPAIFTEEAGHLPEDPDLTLEHVRLAHSFRSKTEARAASSPPPAG